MSVEIQEFEKYGYERFFTDTTTGDDSIFIEQLHEHSLDLAVVYRNKLEDIFDKMDFISCIITVIPLGEKVKAKKKFKYHPVAKVESGIVYLISKTRHNFEFDVDLIKIRKLEYILKEFIEKYYDDLDYIYFGCNKEELFDLYLNLKSSKYKILMPLTEEQETKSKSPNNIYNANNKYNVQKKLF